VCNRKIDSIVIIVKIFVFRDVVEDISLSTTISGILKRLELLLFLAPAFIIQHKVVGQDILKAVHRDFIPIVAGQLPFAFTLKITEFIACSRIIPLRIIENSNATVLPFSMDFGRGRVSIAYS
jgi:hypothetical protein